MFRRFLAAAALGLAAIFAMPALAADPPATSLPFVQGGTTYNECTYNDGTRFYVCHLNFGWTGSAVKALAVDSSGSLAIQDAGGSITVDTGTPGTFAVTSSALPSGASTAALQTASNATLASILSTGIPITSQPLPSGAATAAAQASMLAAESSNTFFASYTTALGSSATYTGAARDVGVAAGVGTPVSYFNAIFYADQAGTAYIDLSDDCTTFTPAVAGTPLVASTPLTLTAPLLARCYRPRLVNGSTAQTVVRVSTAFGRN